MQISTIMTRFVSGRRQTREDNRALMTVIPTEIGGSAVRTGNRASVAAMKLSPGLSGLFNQASKGYHQLETGACLGNVG